MFFMYTCYLNELWTIDIHFPNSHIMAMVHETYLVLELGHIVHDMVTDWVSTGSTETIRETG